ncbi:MAG: 5'-methylthioadenosine/S-adenosylhomocysteine nucleosidase [Bacteroidales bacterium]|nr:5'-methylthioadenosine/S-adenosylhomocysteine nucleosidase [Bacteroidales bacterium]
MTGVLCAMEKELALLRASFGEKRVLCALYGIGKVNAALAAAALADAGAGCMLNIGVAGGLDPSLRCGDVVLCSGTAYHDVWCGEPNLPGQVQGLPARFPADAGLLEKAVQAIPGARCGLCISGDRFVTDPAEAGRLHEAFPEALCLDMEAAAIAQACHLRGVPCLSVKIISDSVSDDDRTGVYEGFWETLAERSFKTIEPLLNLL